MPQQPTPAAVTLCSKRRPSMKCTEDKRWISSLPLALCPAAMSAMAAPTVG